jgi:hypothetical protein
MLIIPRALNCYFKTNVNTQNLTTSDDDDVDENNFIVAAVYSNVT